MKYWGGGVASSRGLLRFICPSHGRGIWGHSIRKITQHLRNLGTVFYRIPKAVKYVEDMIFSWIILNCKRMWKFKQREGHKLLWKFGAVFSPYNNCLQVSRARSDFKTLPWCTIWLYYISKLYWIISNDSTYWNENFLVLPLFKTKASVKIIGGSCTLLHTSPPPSVCHSFHYQSKFKIGKRLKTYCYFH